MPSPRSTWKMINLNVTPMRMKLRSARTVNVVPTRVTDEDRRKRYRTEVLHLPGPLDKWLARRRKLKMPKIRAGQRIDIYVDDVICSLTVEFTKVCAIL